MKCLIPPPALICRGGRWEGRGAPSLLTLVLRQEGICFSLSEKPLPLGPPELVPGHRLGVWGAGLDTELRPAGPQSHTHGQCTGARLGEPENASPGKISGFLSQSDLMSLMGQYHHPIPQRRKLKQMLWGFKTLRVLCESHPCEAGRA